MAARSGGGGSWEGLNGRKDLLWLAREGQGEAVECVALRELGPDRVEIKHHMSPRLPAGGELAAR